jgi:ferredoxin
MSSRFEPYIRWTTRLAFLAVATFLALGGPLPAWAARVLPSLSPLNLLAQTLAQHGWYEGLFWTLPPLFFLVLAALRGRFFCRWVCPAGTLFKLTSSNRLNMRVVRFRFNGILFWIIVTTSLIGLPILLLLDPMPLIQRDLLWLQRPLGWVALIPGLIFPLFLMLGVFQPMIWCTHFCPAGYLFDLARRLKRSPRNTVDSERRDFLAGLCVGLPLAAVATHLPRLQQDDNLPLLPPGAQPPPDFGAICHRCYACVAVCPSGILCVEFKPQRPLVEWLQPEMNAAKGACEEFCNRCSQACPTGAIHKLSINEKRHIQIGTAKVRRDACLAWADHEYCMVCDEYCPYNAIQTDFSPDGLPRPVVNPQICRGCGFCQNGCPAVRDGTAILVHGQRNQRVLPDG